MALFMRFPTKSLPLHCTKTEFPRQRSRRFKPKLIRVRNSLFLVQRRDIEVRVAETPLRPGVFLTFLGGGKNSDVLTFRRWSDEREFQKSKEP